MILFISTGTNDNFVKIIENGKITGKTNWKVSAGQNQKLLKKLAFLVRDKLANLEEIWVFQGPGSYTGLRVGISVANALGISFRIPVKGICMANIGEKDIPKINGLSNKNKLIIPIYNRNL